jgi:hypothetical protein
MSSPSEAFAAAEEDEPDEGDRKSDQVMWRLIKYERRKLMWQTLFRFLRRLERALKERDRGHVERDEEEEESEQDSPGASSPLLATAKPSIGGRFSRQKRVANVYSFEPDRSRIFSDKDYLSD